jgi:heme-degrading monooxygenase HmoA
MADVVFINCFEVPLGREEVFLRLWAEIDDYLRRQPGFHWRRLHRALDSTTRLRYVNVAGWGSAEQFDASHDAEFLRLQAQEGWLEFPAQPALYTVEREDHVVGARS